MNAAVVAQAGRWQISTRSSGEVLTARHAEGDLLMILIGRGNDSGVARLEAGMAEIARESRAASQRATGTRVVPPLLHQALARLVTGPLAGGGQAAAALVVVDDGRDIALGWAGDFEHLVVSDEAAPAPSWVCLRDAAGREARACTIAAETPVQMVFSWPSGPTTPDTPSILIDVTRDAGEQWSEMLTEDPADVEAVLRRMIAVRNRVSDRLSAPPPNVAGDMLPSSIPPSPEPEWLTRRAVDPTPEISAPSPPEVSSAAPADSWRAPVTPMRPAWPTVQQLEAQPVWRSPWIWIALAIAAAIGIGLMIRPRAQVPPVGAGFGGRVAFTIDSGPVEAEILVDGKPVGRRTPATLGLAPGTREITLRVPGLGEARHEVRVSSREPGELKATLAGMVHVRSTDLSVPVTVAIDGTDRGFLPVTLNDVTPGPHQLRFRAPGMEPWAETFELRVGEEREIVTQPFTVPPNGILEVRASRAGDAEAGSLRGANVYIDGELRGTTPLEIELPRGPHSIRLTHGGSEPAIQVIDLPGGNHRFADFIVGGEARAPKLKFMSPRGPMPTDVPTLIAVAISDLSIGEVREAWLHVRSPEGIWRRQRMELKEAAGGVVGSTVFPAGLLDGQGRATYYVSAMTPLGDEFYTEMVVPLGRKPARAKVEPPKPKTPVDSEIDPELDPAPGPVPPAATAPVSPPLPEPVPADPPSEEPLPGEDPPTP